ncbi:unnamed protein product [Arabidopsis thaliana]|uniref:Uncharacterized protein n=1 Tax=Arabidopsis thaliana TaxID=3702 RepID=A0A5S9Y8C7_ARATH|nr:unnamed protein product [Arabidopsis thaliana]
MEIINVAVEVGYIVGVHELNELLSVRTFIALALPTKEFIELFKVVLEGKTLWNSFTLDRFIEVNRNLQMSPPRQLHHLPPPPPIPQGTSARAIASRCKTLSKLIVEACEANKSFLMSTIDKKEYSRTLLVDNGSTEGARFTGTFRFTPRREGRSGRSPRRDRSPRCDSPRPSSRDGTNQRLELIAPLDRLLHPDRWVLLLSSHLLLLDLVAKILFEVRLPDRNMLSLGILLQDGVLQSANAFYSMLTIHLGGAGHRCLEGKFSSLEADLCSRSDSKQKLEDRVDHLSSELVKSNGELQYQRHDKLRTNSRLPEIDSLIGVKSQKRPNLLLLDQTHKEDFSKEQERSELEAVLTEKRSRLAVLPTSILNTSRSSSPNHALANQLIAEALPVVNYETVIVPDDENDVGLEPETTSEQPPAAEPNETEPAFAEPDVAMDS